MCIIILSHSSSTLAEALCLTPNSTLSSGMCSTGFIYGFLYDHNLGLFAGEFAAYQ